MKGRDIIAINDFSKEEILYILDQTTLMKNENRPDLLSGKILGSCFFEPSTRTRLSFESSMHRLGGNVIGFTDEQSTSAAKGESLKDTMKMMEYYVDVVVIRHPLEGAAQLAADALNIPVINAGDGANQHPTQTFQDLFTIQETQKTLEGLHIAFVGDLKHGRTVHSLVTALTLFHPRLYFISHPLLEMPKEICDDLREKGIKFSFHKDIEEVVHKLDILYMTRTQTERIGYKIDDKKGFLTLKSEMLNNAKANLKILHPLPRVDEIHQSIDNTPYAHFFPQVGNGIHTRQALLSLLI